ncbi:DUF6985 domain-containing protein [Myroides odoratimimus]|uniref:DUF6985 domain-containing protein n=1 Tax=Myroides odoratimimus CIP 101113 TaxID=883154 RepID=A0AAV3F3Q9_9FLAO|nr:hypothetical protein [Myroides odoratimimus]EHO12655.1 hypothetical protein HMPREF9715_01810 [Myroides odoratimimus CIP 101113]MDM1512591.1 hypothetical protein [Myroides odoratimimus]SHL26918.1 hypothetical protein SAMN05444275_103136 [Myroides odoratimimus subsp. xuanwuensis]
MEEAQVVIDRIYSYLDRYGLKTNTDTVEDLIAFIEEQWNLADESKYCIYDASIIIGRMTTEYIRLREFEKMMFWLDEGDKHSNKDRNPEYVRNYYKGECCLECGNEEAALHYLNLCYAVEPEYIFTRAPFCYEFFNQHLENPVQLSEPIEEDEVEIEMELELPLWKAFFKMEEAIRCEVLLDYIEDEVDEKEATELMNRIVKDVQENEQTILEELLSKLVSKYEKWQVQYGYEAEDKETFMPDIVDKNQFGMLITPMTIYIIPESWTEPPHIGYLFDCSWDREHALGFMTYDHKVEHIGGADSAFCL